MSSIVCPQHLFNIRFQFSYICCDRLLWSIFNIDRPISLHYLLPHIYGANEFYQLHNTLMDSYISLKTILKCWNCELNFRQSPPCCVVTSLDAAKAIVIVFFCEKSEYIRFRKGSVPSVLLPKKLIVLPPEWSRNLSYFLGQGFPSESFACSSAPVSSAKSLANHCDAIVQDLTAQKGKKARRGFSHCSKPVSHSNKHFLTMVSNIGWS